MKAKQQNKVLLLEYQNILEKTKVHCKKKTKKSQQNKRNTINIERELKKEKQ